MYICKYKIHTDINMNMDNFQQELYQPVLTEPFHQAQAIDISGAGDSTEVSLEFDGGVKVILDLALVEAFGGLVVLAVGQPGDGNEIVNGSQGAKRGHGGMSEVSFVFCQDFCVYPSMTRMTLPLQRNTF